ncbi:MAG: methyltransferase domain-containing protein [Patescibacteria group bacterium]
MDSFSDPTKNVREFGVSEGQKVADFGVGSGFYSFALSGMVGDAGKVYAVDIQKDLLTRLKDEIKRRAIKNIDVIWGDLEAEGGSNLSDDSQDAVIASNIFFQLENKEIFVSEIKRVLKKGGRVLVVDWSDSYGGMGPHIDSVISKEKILELFKQTGFSFEREIPAGEHHFGLIFKKV